MRSSRQIFRFVVFETRFLVRGQSFWLHYRTDLCTSLEFTMIYTHRAIPSGQGLRGRKPVSFSILIAWIVGLALRDANVHGRGKDRGGTEITTILFTEILFCIFSGPRKYFLILFPCRSHMKRRWLVGYQFCQKVRLFLAKWSETNKSMEFPLSEISK